jgi:hypothetical protein
MLLVAMQLKMEMIIVSYELSQGLGSNERSPIIQEPHLKQTQQP